MDRSTEEIIKGYIDKSREKLNTAKRLLEEDLYDDSVSRAYYAVFHAASAALLSEGLTADTHSGLVNLFGLHFIKTGRFDKRFGKYLSNLKEDRENADYEVFSVIDKEETENAVKEAEAFVYEMEKYLKSLGIPL